MDQNSPLYLNFILETQFLHCLWPCRSLWHTCDNLIAWELFFSKPYFFQNFLFRQILTRWAILGSMWHCVTSKSPMVHYKWVIKTFPYHLTPQLQTNTYSFGDFLTCSRNPGVRGDVIWIDLIDYACTPFRVLIWCLYSWKTLQKCWKKLMAAIIIRVLTIEVHPFNKLCSAVHFLLVGAAQH